MARKRSGLEQFRRRLYFAQRTIGDFEALQRGRLPQRLIRRRLQRSLFRSLRSMGRGYR